METEELKKTWNLLDEHLRRQEILNTALMKENLLGKSTKRLGQMINYSYFGLALMTVGLVAVAYTLAIQIIYFGFGRLHSIIMLVVTLFMLFAIVTGIVGLAKLQKIDFSAPVSENMRHMEEYRIWYSKITLLTWIFSGVLITVIFAVIAIFENVSAWQWAVICGMIGVGIVLGRWEYKRMFRKNIDSILKDLEELEKLKSE
ncbi:MAG: hypothetical protein LBC19_16580 [Tannerella sp.]|jgi:hypothetical protein|nr:hypothetical protein [Tannerella sp.]